MIPQIIWIVLQVFFLVIVISSHGKPSGVVNGWHHFWGATINFWILYWGGFFDCFFK